MSEDEWGETLSKQVKRYYRPLDAPDTATETKQADLGSEATQPRPHDPHVPKFAFQDLSKMRKQQPLKK